MKLQLLLTGIAIGAVLLVLVIGQAVYYGIGPMPSTPRSVRAILKLLPHHLQGKVFELGAGWGTLAWALARQLPSCQVIGYEGSLIPYFVCLVIRHISGCDNLSFRRANFFDCPLQEAALVICYLYPGAMVKLKRKFERELPAGAYVLCHTFAIAGWQPIGVYYLQDIYRTPLYLYQVRNLRLA